jgi:hypothetical protein
VAGRSRRYACLILSRTGQQIIDRLAGRVKRVSALGVELELTAEAATKIKADLEETFRAYRTAIVSEFDRQASILHLAELRRRVVDEAVTPYLNRREGCPPTYRCTIHVRDILLHEAMYQLLDYFPVASTGGSGRTFSMRFGIVGQAWRTGASQREQGIQPGDQHVVIEWGMLPEEAAAAGYGKRSFAAALLQDDALTVGVFYLDSPDPHAFGEEMISAIEQCAKKVGCTELAPESDRGSNVFGQGCDGPAPLAGGALVHGQHA